MSSTGTLATAHEAPAKTSSSPPPRPPLRSTNSTTPSTKPPGAPLPMVGPTTADGAVVAMKACRPVRAGSTVTATAAAAAK